MDTVISPTLCLIRLNDVTSTNDEARRYAALGVNDGTLIWADSQSKGRGRQGRTWTSPPGNLYMSLLLRPDVPPADALQIGFVASLAIAEAVDAVAPSGTTVQVKWPNDVLVNGKKVCGMLLESSMKSDGSAVDWLIIGMGVNIKVAPDDTPYPATTLENEGVSGLTVGDLLIRAINRFEEWRGRWTAEGFGPVREAWLARAAGLGKPIEVRLPDDALKGTFRGLDDAGALMLETPDGTRQITMGDVFPADDDAEAG